MIILAVDDEVIGLTSLKKSIEKAIPEAEVAAFSSAKEALAFAKGNDIFAAFLDIEMAEMKGTELAKKLKIIKPTIHCIFATGFDNFMGDAFALHASGYVLKPITSAKIKKEYENIKSLSKAYVENAAKEKTKLRFQCFGNFEVFNGSEVLHFKYDRTKELLAYLVSRRGALCSNGEIITHLFEDDQDHESYLRGLRKDLSDSLEAVGFLDVLNVQRGKMGIVADNVLCDYYDFIKDDAAAINSYQGEFMAQYSWGELTNAELMGY